MILIKKILTIPKLKSLRLESKEENFRAVHIGKGLYDNATVSSHACSGKTTCSNSFRLNLLKILNLCIYVLNL